jgi:hypothetical protein
MSLILLAITHELCADWQALRASFALPWPLFIFKTSMKKTWSSCIQ